MSTLAQALLLAAGLSPTEQQNLETPIPYEKIREIETTVLGGLESLPDDVKESIAWRLESKGRIWERENKKSYDLKTIEENLPKINAIIAELDSGAKITTEDDVFGSNPIKELQGALGFEKPDGVFGPATSRALLETLQSNVGKISANLDDFSNLKEALNRLAPDELRHYKTIKEHKAELDAQSASYEAEIAEKNEIIAEAFETCIGSNVIDLDTESPFEDIVQEIINAYANNESEQLTANQRFSNAVKDSCGKYLKKLPEDLQKTLLSDLATKVQGPIETEVDKRINQAISNHESALVHEGRVLGIIGRNSYGTQAPSAPTGNGPAF